MEDICNALGKATSIEFGECNAFVKHLISKKDLEEPAALLIWKRVINALEKEYRMELADGEDAELASKI